MAGGILRLRLTKTSSILGASTNEQPLALSLSLRVRQEGVSMSTRQLELPLDGWEYVGEGRAHVVVRHPDALCGRVLRFSKTRDGHPGINANVTFVRDLVTPIVGAELLGSWEYIRVPPVTAGRILAEVDDVRPAGRRREIDTESLLEVAMLLPDWRIPMRAQRLGVDRRSMVLPSITVELKPKCGYPSVLDADGSLIPKCRHCLHQPTKVASGKWASLSRFCPVDLFSNHRPRVERAVRGLIQTPQNNLRVFSGLSTVYSDGIGDTDTMADEIARILTLSERPPCPAELEANEIVVAVGAQGVDRLGLLAEVVTETLLAHRVLPKILELQRLGTNDSRAVAELLERFVPVDCESVDEAVWGDGVSSSDGSPKDTLQRFMSAMVGKDVSIMLNITPVASPMLPDDSDSSSTFHYVARASILDFDLKRWVK